jgi:molybdopterin converting factor small subunit
MPQATFWFASPFREWIGRTTVTVQWEGRITLREVLTRFATDHPRFGEKISAASAQQEAFDHIAAVIAKGDFLALDSSIPDGSTVDVLTPLAGGRRRHGSGESRGIRSLWRKPGLLVKDS